MQETKSKIDLFFKNKSLNNNSASVENLRNQSMDEGQKNSKLEGTMKLLKNISSKSVIGSSGSFGKVYNRTTNKILIKKQQNNNVPNYPPPNNGVVKVVNLIQKK